MKKGVLVCLSGFSGAGKGTIVKEVLKRHPHYALSISATTRDPRAGEEEGLHYFFKTREEFERMIDEDRLLEHAEYSGNYYGTPKAYVEEMLEKGKDVILEIEVQGALQVKAKNPETILIFVAAPDICEIRNRLVKRGTETEEQIARRMAQIKRELASVPAYDYLLVNDDLDETVERFNDIVECQHSRVVNNFDFLYKLEREAEEI